MKATAKQLPILDRVAEAIYRAERVHFQKHGVQGDEWHNMGEILRCRFFEAAQAALDEIRKDVHTND